MPGWGMHPKLRKPHRVELKGTSGMLAGALSVDAGGFDQSTVAVNSSTPSAPPPMLSPSTGR